MPSSGLLHSTQIQCQNNEFSRATSNSELHPVIALRLNGLGLLHIICKFIKSVNALTMFLSNIVILCSCRHPGLVLQCVTVSAIVNNCNL